MFRSKNGDVTGICDSCGTFGEELNLEDLGCIYPLVNVYSLLLKMAIEKVDFPMNNGDFP